MNETEIPRLMHVDIESIEAPPSRHLDVDRAMRTGRRQRWYGRSAGATLLVAALAVGVTILPGLRTTVGGISETGQGRGNPLVVTAYSGVRDVKVDDPSPAFNYSLLLNPQTGEYERFNYNLALPSPDGSRVLVGLGDNSQRYPSRRGILDRATGAVQWIEAPERYFGYTDTGEWSPDGRRILFTHKPRVGAPGFGLVDVDTLRITHVPLPDLASQDAAGLGLAWTARNDEIALTLTTLDDDQGHQVSGIRFYDLLGKALRTIPATAALTSGTAFSPDGTRITLTQLSSGPEHTVFTIVDTATGAVRQSLTAPGIGGLLGWRDDNHLVTRLYEGTSPGTSAEPSRETAVQGRLSVIDLTGRETHRMPLPAEFPQQIYIGPATGLPAGSAKYTF